MRQTLRTLVFSTALFACAGTVNAQIKEPIQEPFAEPIQEPVVEPRERLLLKNFHYLSPSLDEMVPSDFMLIEDGIITSINKSEGLCAGCDVIDLEGGYLIPGLMDLHQHLSTGGFAKNTHQQKIALLRRNFYWGITTVYNPNIKLPLLKAVRQALQKNPRRYPEFFAAGQNIGIQGGWGDVFVSDYRELKITATRQLEASADNIKISMDDMSWLSSTPMTQFPELLLKQAAALMHENNRRLFLHASQAKDVETALKAGVDVIIHGTVDKALSQETLGTLAKKKTGYISTLALFETISNVNKAVEAMRGFDPHAINGKNLYDNMGSELMAENWRDWWNESHLLKAKLPILRGNTVALVNAGGIVGIGTDAGTPSIIFGSALPYEMHLHEQIGLFPLKVIKMATSGNAKILQIEGRTGSIREGLEADLVFMRTNPTAGIKALNSAEWTMQNGSITYRQELLGGN